MHKIFAILLIIICNYSFANVALVNLKIDGRITNETLKEFNQALIDIEKNHQTIVLNAVQLNSTGGSVEIGWEIGRLIRKKKLNTYVGKDSRCDSACIYILIGGIQRYAFGEVGVHRTTFATDVPDDKFVKPFIEESIKLNNEYIKSMGISAMLSDALETTESWRIRSLTEVEKRQWQIFGTDRLEEELLFNQIARDRYISRHEFIDIFKSNYEDCLSDARDLKQTIFACAKDKSLKSPSYYNQLLKWLVKKFDLYPRNNIRDLPHPEQVELIRKQIRDGKLYKRYTTITEVNDLNPRSIQLKSIDMDSVRKMEAANIWWVEGDALSVLASNPIDVNLKEIYFELSTTNCGTSGGKKRLLSVPMLVNLEERNSAVYSGQLPFNYEKIIGKGTRCGVIKAAFK